MMSLNILAFTKYSYEGPSSRYRFYNYRKCFEGTGISLTISPLFDSSYFAVRGKTQKMLVVSVAYLKRLMQLFSVLIAPRKYDLMLIEYELLPFFPPLFEYLLKRRGIHYFVDYDDAIFHKYDLSGNPLVKYFLKNKIADVIKYADEVIVCNAYLEAYAKAHNTNTHRLPTVVLLDRYEKEIKEYAQKEKETFVIGWIGSRTTSVYIMEILPTIEKFVRHYPKCRFDLVGFDASLLDDAMCQKHHIRIIPWQEEKEIENILSFDVGIMPLRDDPWSRGKCGFKLIQYMSCGKPVIASPVGVNVDIVEEGGNGYLVKNWEEWFNAFEKLYLNGETRARMMHNNLNKIIKEFNNKQNCIKYVKLIEKYQR